MRTAAIVHDFPSHTETFIASQIQGLVELGCDVRIFADGPDSLASTRANASDELRARVAYYGLPLKRVRDAAGRLRAVIPFASAPRKRKSGGGRAGFRQRLEARRFAGLPLFDVIHAHFGPNGVRAVRLRELGVLDGPIITSFYGYDVARSWSLAGYDRLFTEGHLFLALSRHMRDTLLSLGCPRDRIRIHPVGVDLDRFKPGPRTARSRLEVSSIARLVPKKGIEYGLDAIAELVRRRVPVRYSIVGTGMLQSSLERRASRLGISAHVRYLGPQSQDDVIAILGDTDVLLAPSVTAPDGDVEGTPVVILEAQACGVPVVATRHAGIPEIVRDGESGYLAGERNSLELADLLERCADSASHRTMMGCAGRAIVAENHDLRKLNGQLIDIYRDVMA